MGITATIVCRNESSWIYESILSIEPFVDEIIILNDKSEDNTLNIVQEVQRIYSKIIIFNVDDIPELKNKTLGYYKNFVVNKSSNEWILRWDGDFIAYNQGVQDIKKLLEFARITKDFDGFILSGPNLSGDINHQDPNKLTYGPECYLFKKNMVKFKTTDKYCDELEYSKNIKLCYPKHQLGTNTFFIHMNTLKPIEKLVYRLKMTKFQIETKGSDDYWGWMLNKHNLTKEMLVNQYLNNELIFVDFDYNRWGQHPEILLESKRVNNFKILPKNNKFNLDYPKYVNDI